MSRHTITMAVPRGHGGERPAAVSTDWDRYYQQPWKVARLSRRITAAHLLRQIGRFVRRRGVIVELGGADSCFFDVIRGKMHPRQYHVVDNNRLGLERFHRRVGKAPDVFVEHQDVLELSYPVQADLVFSAGLIEHFDRQRTRSAVEAHFQLLAPGGIAVMTFPTPTLLYRAVRGVAERAGTWGFPDERPLRFEEVAAAARPHGQLLHREVIWPIVLTQCLAAWRKC